MRFDLRALEDEPRSASVALESITLAVEQRGRETQEHPKQLGPDSVEVTFPLTVRRGMARFLPEIRTRNGTVVFEGNTVVDVRRNGFVAKVPLVQKVPLMMVGPRTVVLEEVGGYFQVRSRATTAQVGDLEWRITAVTPNSCSGDPCLSIPEADSLWRRLAPGEVGYVHLARLAAPSGSTYTIRVSSPAGDIDVIVTVP